MDDRLFTQLLEAYAIAFGVNNRLDGAHERFRKTRHGCYSSRPPAKFAVFGRFLPVPSEIILRGTVFPLAPKSAFAFGKLGGRRVKTGINGYSLARIWESGENG
jgi:hypothetical protein